MFPLSLTYFEKGNPESFKMIKIDEGVSFSNPPKHFYPFKDLKFKELYAYSNQIIDIYKPLNSDCDDFIINYLSSKDYHKKDEKRDLSEYNGCLYSEFLPVYTSLGVLKSFKKVYQNNITLYAKFMIHDSNDNLLFSYESKIFKSKGLIFVLTNNVTDSEALIEENKKIFYQYNPAVVISKNQVFINKNKKFKDLEKKYSIFNFEDMIFKDFTHEEWLSFYDEILKMEVLSYSGEVEFKLNNGSSAYFSVYISPEYYESESVVKFYFRDITSFKYDKFNSKIFQQNLLISEKLNKFALLHVDNTGYFNWDREIYDILELNKSEIQNYDSDYNFFRDFLDSESKDKFDKIVNGEIDHFYNKVLKITSAKGNIKYLTVYSFVSGNLYNNGYNRIIFYVQDITRLVSIQEELKSNNMMIESNINSDEVLLKEVHHRVKNNLQIILSLLNIDYNFNKDNPETTIWNTINRINSMAFIHDKTYQSNSMDYVNVRDYIVSESSQIFSLYGGSNINLHTDIDSMELNMDIITPLGLMINELILNTIKYAFPSGEGDLWIKLKKADEGMVLTVCDNGVGLPSDLNINTTSSLGMTILQSLTKQIDGELINLKPSKGTGIMIKFPI
ncbi:MULTISPECIES: histidine kinase dimerization/phosphoacceptor domain -containing protein [unclassified Methanobrevibacter]|jgi:two-component sensor histidine kinase|uniref:histidine kinase dimerization/phosphoacceptor domain -containing protein n=1 Tax=unclassified Methanobrevibacter TaxID=2638681 RepID=UPI002A0AC03F|nr:sensor histidine kinase [Methanobacteriaceae archaeon]